jgi:hypothetical protein
MKLYASPSRLSAISFTHRSTESSATKLERENAALHIELITQQGVGVVTGPAKFVVEALRSGGWTGPGDRWREAIGPLAAHMCTVLHLWWVSWWTRRLLVVTGARCPLTKPVVTAVEQQAATEPHCSRGVQPGSICVQVGAAVQPARADSRRPWGPGVGPAPRPQALPIPAAALALYP